MSLNNTHTQKVLNKSRLGSTHLLHASLSTGPNKSRFTLAIWFVLGMWHRTFGDFLYSSDMNNGFSTLALIFYESKCLQIVLKKKILLFTTMSSLSNPRKNHKFNHVTSVMRNCVVVYTHQTVLFFFFSRLQTYRVDFLVHKRFFMLRFLIRVQYIAFMYGCKCLISVFSWGYVTVF